jgi:LysR family transcriptional regulator, glycine cleavage system transcriptional activator
VHLFTETLFPVCSPAIAAAYPMHEPRDVLAAPLVHHRHRPWSLWFDAFGLARPRVRGPAFEDSVLVLEAAAQGLGVALARSGLSEGDLASGRLIRPLEAGIASELGFFAVWRADSRKAPRIRALADWLAAEAQASGPDEAMTS